MMKRPANRISLTSKVPPRTIVGVHRVKQRHKRYKLVLPAFICCAFASLSYLFHGDTLEPALLTKEQQKVSEIKAETKPKPKPKPKPKRKEETKTKTLSIATIDEVVEFLNSLARMPTVELQESLDPSKKDVFHLSQLEQGTCPITNDNWLPPQPSDKAAKLFRNRNKPTRKHSRQDPIPMLWYEHLSKAGGTSFCKLAIKNMYRSEVPSYYCMPSTQQDPDARVGLWSNKRLDTYMRGENKRIVSNEWNPFDPARFYLQPSDNDNTSADNPPTSEFNAQLVFVTTIREPLNRLLSAHQFWGILHGPKNKPTLPKWLHRRNYLARKAHVPDMGVANHVARYNFAAWKFSNGMMPLPQSPLTHKESDIPPNMIDYEAYGDDWRIPFQDAVRNLARFDLVIPLEVLWNHSQPLADVLGYTNLKEVHVVPTGKVKDTNAKSSMPPNQYEVLWNANRLDIILHAWSKAVYLARLFCGTDGWGLD